MFPAETTRPRRKRRLFTLMSGAALVPLLLLVAIIPSCNPPNFATEADVLAVLQQPRTDEELKDMGDLGRRLFLKNNCQQCHVVEGIPRAAPRLANLYTTQAILRDGTKIDRDQAYVIRSILRSQEQIVVGYPQQMSSYRHLPPEDVAALVVYLERYSPAAEPQKTGEQDSAAADLPIPQE
ncbi:MAG: cytochrome c [Planctomycetota bacterium]